ncbi:MAG: tol-pal system YbgF family protein [Pyrinomonadaceae bacterium]
MARYQRKRARELQHDRFRDTTMNLLDRLGDRLAGKGRTILYGIAAVIALAVLFSLVSSWRERKANEARRALGHAIEIAEAPVNNANATPPPAAASGLSFSSERERAQKAVEEFQKVADKYPDPYRENARYFAANNLLTLDHNKGIAELQSLTKSGDREIATLAKFALAQAYEADAKYNEAAPIYNELAKANSELIPADTANLRLASVYEKLDKKKEAADIYFAILDASRKAKGADGKPATQTSAAREADQKLATLDPARYAQLPTAPVASNLAF